MQAYGRLTLTNYLTECHCICFIDLYKARLAFELVCIDWRGSLHPASVFQRVVDQ